MPSEAKIAAGRANAAKRWAKPGAREHHAAAIKKTIQARQSVGLLWGRPPLFRKCHLNIRVSDHMFDELLRLCAAQEISSVGELVRGYIQAGMAKDQKVYPNE